MNNNDNKLPRMPDDVLSYSANKILPYEMCIGYLILDIVEGLEAPETLLAAICFMVVSSEDGAAWASRRLSCYKTSDNSRDKVVLYVQ